jgi:hypothetical protein
MCSGYVPSCLQLRPQNDIRLSLRSGPFLSAYALVNHSFSHRMRKHYLTPEYDTVDRPIAYTALSDSST